MTVRFGGATGFVGHLNYLHLQVSAVQVGQSVCECDM
jgi:hypothetical protein